MIYLYEVTITSPFDVKYTYCGYIFTNTTEKALQMIKDTYGIECVAEIKIKCYKDGITQVSADECVNMQYYLDAYCQEVDIKDSICAFLGCEEGLND